MGHAIYILTVTPCIYTIMFMKIATVKEVSDWDEIYGKYKAGYDANDSKCRMNVHAWAQQYDLEQLCEAFKYLAIVKPDTYCIVVCELKTIVLESLYFVAIQANYRVRTGTNDRPAGRRIFVPKYCCSYEA